MSVPSSAIHQSGNRWKPPNVHRLTNVTDETNVVGQTMEYYLAIKRNEMPIHATMRANLGDIMLSDKSQTHNRPQMV